MFGNYQETKKNESQKVYEQIMGLRYEHIPREFIDEKDVTPP